MTSWFVTCTRQNALLGNENEYVLTVRHLLVILMETPSHWSAVTYGAGRKDLHGRCPRGSLACINKLAHKTFGRMRSLRDHYV